MSNVSKRAVNLAVMLTALAAGVALAATDSGSSCCFTQDCGDKHVTDCLGTACASGYACSGDGGCTPRPWAVAECIKRP